MIQLERARLGRRGRLRVSLRFVAGNGLIEFVGIDNLGRRYAIELGQSDVVIVESLNPVGFRLRHLHARVQHFELGPGACT